MSYDRRDLVRIRTTLGLSREQMAGLLYLDMTTLYRWEEGDGKRMHQFGRIVYGMVSELLAQVPPRAVHMMLARARSERELVSILVRALDRMKDRPAKEAEPAAEEAP